jgi:hypothetical protein
MITRENFPLVAKQVGINLSWSSSATDDVQLDSAYLTFDNVNITSCGEVAKERTALAFNSANPITWGTSMTDAGLPQDMMEVVATIWQSPEDALKDILGIIYESSEHQIRLGTIPTPITQETETLEPLPPL